MLERVLRILIGFVLACVAAAVTLVLFVYAPSDLAALREELNGDRLSEAGFFALLITPHVLISAAFPALLAAVFAEQRKLASWPYYALAGIATAGAGFLVQYLTEPPTRALSILQTYALIAFLTAGLIGGLVYWALAGRFVPTKPP
jgi:hypothetical protein